MASDHHQNICFFTGRSKAIGMAVKQHPLMPEQAIKTLFNVLMPLPVYDRIQIRPLCPYYFATPSVGKHISQHTAQHSRQRLTDKRKKSDITKGDLTDASTAGWPEKHVENMVKAIGRCT